MATLNINLLPENLTLNSKTTKWLKLLNRILVIGVVVFVFACLVSAIALFVFSLQLKNLVTEKSQVEGQVKTYQETEQKLFFIQDRLTKVKTVKTLDTTSKSMDGFKQILDILPATAQLKDAEVNNVSISAVVQLSSSSEVTTFLSQIVTKDFQRINLKDFSVNPQTGYLLTLIFYLK
jgi:hypothetical protein